MSSKRIIVVVGMHRTGSSAITRGLSVLGVDLGENLMPPSKNNNEKGFWEDLDIYEFNERLLLKAKSAWHSLAPLDYEALPGAAFSEERREAKALLKSKLESGRVYAFKDPRTAIILPFWQSVFEDLELKVSYVVSVRNPLESAVSLEKREGFPTIKGLLLWAKHIIEALRSTSGKPRIFVSYDNILENPEHELIRIAKAVHLPWPGDSTKALSEYREQFLSSELRHNKAGIEDLRRPGLTPAFIIKLYELVEAWASADPAATLAPPKDVWARIESGYDELASLLNYFDELEKARDYAINQNCELTSRIDSLADQHSKNQTDISAITEARDSISRELLLAQAELKQNRAIQTKKTEKIKRLEMQQKKLKENFTRTQSQAARLQRQIESIKLSNSWRLTAPIRSAVSVIRKLPWPKKSAKLHE